jgi:pyroglutamyl-peptidase
MGVSMKLLLTGFEPFGGSTLNPSEQIVRLLTGKEIDRVQIVSAVLPVDQAQAAEILIDVLGHHRPDAVLCLGEASRRAVISVERLAVNLLDFRIPDNAGCQLVDQPIIHGGPAAYFVTLPDRFICKSIQQAGVPAELSLSAGTYLCNQVLYRLLHYLSEEQWHIPAGFIHLCALPEQAAAAAAAVPSMSLETSLRGVQAAVKAITHRLHAGGDDLAAAVLPAAN